MAPKRSRLQDASEAADAPRYECPRFQFCAPQLHGRDSLCMLLQANMTTGMDTAWHHVGFGNNGSESSYFQTWLVREAQIRDRGYVTGDRYKGDVTDRSGRKPRQPPFAAHPQISDVRKLAAARPR